MGSRKTRRRERARRRRGVRKGIPLGLANVPAYVEICMKLTCRVCKKELDAEKDFYPRAGSRTGYQYECKKCRKEINAEAKQKKKEREEEARKAAPKKKKSTWNHREAHRKKLLQSSGTAISAGELIAETPRSMSFTLSLIVEQQLRLFYSKQINSAAASLKMAQILEDTLFEVKQAFSRAGVRMKPLFEMGGPIVDLEGSMKSLQAKAAARILLGVQEGATQEEIKTAYRSKARKAHPDLKGKTEEMQKINEAYTLLVEDTNGR